MENKKKRIAVVISAIAIQSCLGIAYVWSLFQTGIAESLFNGDNAKASLSFSILLALLSIGSVIGGKLSNKISTRRVVIIGGIILSIGFFLSAFVPKNAPWLLWVTYGVMGGIGMGFTYTTTIACAQKWFPDKKGLITGLIVAALGFGGVIFTPIIENLIIAFGGTGVGEQKTFMVLSAVFLVVCCGGAIFLANPPQNPNASQIGTENDFSPIEVLRNPNFYMLTIAFMLSCMGGLMMIGFAKPIAVAKGMGATATIGVLAISLFNSIGRLTWGAVCDKIGRKKTIYIILAGTAISSVFAIMAEGYFIYVIISLIGFFYGGLLSTFPSFTADLFGARYMATNYGMVLGGFGIGAIISSSIAGYYKNIAANDISLMLPAFIIAAGAAVLSFVIIKFIKVEKKA